MVVDHQKEEEYSYYNNFKNSVLEEFDGYNFNKKNIRLGNNIYFINFDVILSNYFSGCKITTK